VDCFRATANVFTIDDPLPVSNAVRETTDESLRYPTLMNPYWIVVGFPSLLQLLFFLRWLHRRTRDDEIRRAFVRDMAINHLPHLYHALRQIAGHLGIEIKDPPPVQFLELNGQDRKR
jgi:hypothetical protein